jgi:hypothetical protein
MEVIKNKVHDWFSQSSANEDDILSLELISLDSSSLNFRSGDENLVIKLIASPNDTAIRYIIEYHGDDDFFNKLIKRLNAQLSSMSTSTDLIEILEKFSSEANTLYSSMNQDDSYDDGYNEDEGDEAMDESEQESELQNDIFRPLSHEEEVKLKQRLMDKIAAQAVSSSVQSSSLAAPTGPKKTVKSIFSEGTSSIILINEFLAINRICREDGIIVEAVDDNVFSWRVRFYKFKGDRELSVDLISLDEHYG